MELGLDTNHPTTLLVFIDDATGLLMQLRFVASESAFSYFEALEGGASRADTTP